LALIDVIIIRPEPTGIPRIAALRNHLL